jgi:hypothetical protein
MASRTPLSFGPAGGLATEPILSLPSGSFQATGAYWNRGPAESGNACHAARAGQSSRRLVSSGALAAEGGSVLAAASKYAGTEQRWWRCGTIRAAALASDLASLTRS